MAFQLIVVSFSLFIHATYETVLYLIKCKYSCFFKFVLALLSIFFKQTNFGSICFDRGSDSQTELNLWDATKKTSRLLTLVPIFWALGLVLSTVVWSAQWNAVETVLLPSCLKSLLDWLFEEIIVIGFVSMKLLLALYHFHLFLLWNVSNWCH